MSRLMQMLFGRHKYTSPECEVRRRDEEQKKMQQVREQLDRVTEVVAQIDRRRASRESQQ